METLTREAILPDQGQQAGVVITQRKRADCQINLALAEFVLRIFCELFCIAVLVAAALVLSSIDEVDDYVDNVNTYGSYYTRHPYYHYSNSYRHVNVEYKHANSYRGAAEWMVCIASLGILFHPVMLFVRYLCCRAYVRSLFAIYSYVNAALCIVFALSFFSGGVANAVYADDNVDNVDDLAFICGRDTDACNALKRVRDSEVATAAMGFTAMTMFIALSVVMTLSGVIKMPDTQRQQRAYSSPINRVPPTQVPTNVVHFHPADAPPPYMH